MWKNDYIVPGKLHTNTANVLKTLESNWQSREEQKNAERSVARELVMWLVLDSFYTLIFELSMKCECN